MHDTDEQLLIAFRNPSNRSAQKSELVMLTITNG